MAGNRAKELSSPPPPPENQNKTVKVHVGVFFDGTGAGGALSRGRDKSNVELLHTYYPTTKENYVCELYLKGIGVADSAGDVVKGVLKGGLKGAAVGGAVGGVVGGVIGGITGAIVETQAGGLAAGTGTMGIETKVKKAIKDIPGKVLEKKIPKEANIDLHFELFGFSRGAAAARHFVRQITKKKTSTMDSLVKKLKSKKYKINDITISYVGLFDTVSSHGINHKNDVKTLGLDAIKEAKHVFHICAADEFRANFALTNIQSAEKKGTEIFIPGSHTDVGGGIDPKWKNNASKYGDGWTDSSENVESGYSHIALNIMATESNKERKKFNNIEFYKVPDDLKATEQTIQNNMSRLKSAENCFNLQEFKYKDLRAKWLHFSAAESGLSSVIDSPRIVEGKLKRELIHG